MALRCASRANAPISATACSFTKRSLRTVAGAPALKLLPASSIWLCANSSIFMMHPSQDASSRARAVLKRFRTSRPLSAYSKYTRNASSMAATASSLSCNSGREATSWRSSAARFSTSARLSRPFSHAPTLKAYTW